MHAGKTLGWAGATPKWTAFSRPKFFGVAPARHRETVTVFCPRAYRGVSNSECKKERSPNTEERIAMPVLKAPPKQPKTTVVQLRLDDETRIKLTKYAEFLDCSTSYVVTEALKLVCNKDKEFQSWLSGQHPSKQEAISKGESFQLELK
jgi:predicted transcriptional regulator